MQIVSVLLLTIPVTIAFTGSNPNGAPVIVKGSDSLFLPKSPPAVTVVCSSGNDKLSSTSNKNGKSNSVVSSVVLRRKKWGVDHEHPEEYWFDKRIHTLGNVGVAGALHAALAPVSTKLIDKLAYNGVDVRRKIADELFRTVGKSRARVLDLCCGVGFSTRALKHAFPDADTVLGIDTSKEMIAMAEFISEHINHLRPMFGLNKYDFHSSESIQAVKKKGYAVRKRIMYSLRNAEDTNLPSKSFDLITIMYAFHEAPSEGRHAILEEARRLLAPGGVLAVLDISTDYTPSQSMLMGEPYVQEYQANIHQQLERFLGFQGTTYQTVIPHHLGMWTLKRSPSVP